MTSLTNIKFITLILLSLLLCLSCGKDRVDTEVLYSEIPLLLKPYIERHDCLNAPVNGMIHIVNSETIHTQDSKLFTVSGRFWNTPDKFEDRGKLLVNNKNVLFNNERIYKTILDDEVFGNEIPIKLGDNYISTEIKLPKAIKFLSPSTDESGKLEIAASNGVVTWNTDTNNSLGVAVSITYYPTYPGNTQFIKDGYDSLVVNSEVVKDNGTFTITNSLFDGIPDGAKVSVRLVRMNCNHVNDEKGLKNIIVGYTNVEAVALYDASVF